VSAVLICLGFISAGAAQDRQRVVKTVISQPVTYQPERPQTPRDKTKTLSSSIAHSSTPARPTLTNKIVVAAEPVNRPLVRKTAASAPLNSIKTSVATRLVYGLPTSNGIMGGIQSRMGIPYLYGSSGPNRYDCSGFVWSVSKEAGIDFERVSARSLWASGTPVEGDERYRFGTLVFMNGLGHMGIVADEKGFYHASSSKGITYSPFNGYWEKRIVGFRRLNAAAVDYPTAVADKIKVDR